MYQYISREDTHTKLKSINMSFPKFVFVILCSSYANFTNWFGSKQLFDDRKMW